MPHVYKSYKLFDQYWSGNYWNKVSIDLTEIKKCVHSSFNFLIYNLMGKFISKNPKIITGSVEEVYTEAVIQILYAQDIIRIFIKLWLSFHYPESAL